MSSSTTLLLSSTLCASLLVGCSAGPAPVSFKSEVKPLVDKYCTECHLSGGAGAEASGFITASYASLMKGTKFGPVVVAGDPLSSSFYRLVAGKVDPSIRMPHGKEALSEVEIAVIENWIAQGAENN
ncbi:c-type cytochrome domain-containing protein [Candidatus Thiodiazotropha sp. CDECU1]|uniref:c-type cytochrome domain-containing protein n=1 Tax=Candidatus Thiodiazotropha sp. CDECU1 TaxID=3065865 RepID=UPI0029314AF0|nr:c-type cytochrome domain-containing protein [Candidatus Thiodiazotropha sp. CDECU1]